MTRAGTGGYKSNASHDVRTSPRRRVVSAWQRALELRHQSFGRWSPPLGRDSSMNSPSSFAHTGEGKIGIRVHRQAVPAKGKVGQTHRKSRPRSSRIFRQTVPSSADRERREARTVTAAGQVTQRTRRQLHFCHRFSPHQAATTDRSTNDRGSGNPWPPRRSEISAEKTRDDAVIPGAIGLPGIQTRVPRGYSGAGILPTAQRGPGHNSRQPGPHDLTRPKDAEAGRPSARTERKHTGGCAAGRVFRFGVWSVARPSRLRCRIADRAALWPIIPCTPTRRRRAEQMYTPGTPVR